MDTYVNDKMDKIIESLNNLNNKIDKLIELAEENESKIQKLEFDIYDVHNKLIGY